MVQMMMMNESVIVSSVICLLYFDVSPHFSPLNGLERSKNSPWRLNTEYDGLERSQNGPWKSTVYVSDGLESSQFCSYTQWS